MFELLFPFFLIVLFILVLTIIWRNNARKYISAGTEATVPEEINFLALFLQIIARTRKNKTIKTKENNNSNI